MKYLGLHRLEALVKQQYIRTLVWLATRSSRFFSRESAGIHCKGGWLDLGASLDKHEKTRPHRDSNPEPYRS